ncbi:MAG: hypothetical protein JWR05_315 [Mucilaginibacter sp.]|nr:hypothetical protein [Mucilaginibacter sp.]
MKTVIVRYKVKPGRVEEHEQLVKAVFGELHKESPEGFNYATFKMEDGLSFTHIAVNKNEGRSPLQDLPAFKKFQEGLKDRCDELPLANHVTEIGSYGFLFAGTSENN